MKRDRDDLVDLANFHFPVSDFLSLSNDEWPITQEMYEKYKLSDAQIEQYKTDGFIDNVKVLSDRQVERLKRDLDDIKDPQNPKNKLWHEYNENEAGKESGKVLFHSLGAWRISESFHDLIFHPAILVPTSQLLAEDSNRYSSIR